MQIRKTIALVAAGLICSSVLPAATAQRKKTRRPPKKTVAAQRSTWRAGQAAPTAERYKQIQEALAKKGYLQGEPTGKWDQDSADALRRFQQDQNLQASGKLDSLSIIALGLGPQR